MVESLVGAVLLVISSHGVTSAYFSSPEACERARAQIVTTNGLGLRVRSVVCATDFFLVPEGDVLAVEDPR